MESTTPVPAAAETPDLPVTVTVTLGRLLADVSVVLRVAVTTLTLTPIMTYLLLPWVTRRLEGWLHGRSWRDR